MGMDPATIAIISSMGANALSGFLGANSQSNANAANLAYTQQHNAMLQGYVNQMMQQGTNPYSQALMSFLGRGMPSTGSIINQPGFLGGSTPNNGGGTPTPPNSDPNGGGTPNPNPSNPNGGGQINPNPSGTMAPSNPLAWLLGGGGGAVAQQQLPPSLSRASYFAQNPNASEQDWQKYGSSYGVLPDGGDAAPSAGITSAGAAQMNAAALPPTTPSSAQTFQHDLTSYTDYISHLGFDPNTTQVGMDGSIMDSRTGATLRGADQTLAGMRTTVTTPTSSYTPPPLGPASYLQGGQTFTDLNQAMAAFNWLKANPGQSIAPQMQGGQYTPDTLAQLNVPNFNMQPGGLGGNQTPFGGLGLGIGLSGQPQVGGYNGTNMYGYQPIQAAQYAPTQLGNAPMASLGNMFQAPQLGSAQSINPTGVQAQQLGQINGVQVPTVGTNVTVGSQGFNTGQDSMMQAMRAQPTPSLDPTAQLTLQQQTQQPSMFQGSQSADALTGLANFNLGNQLDQLHASFGTDLGKRFGTGMMQAESQLRGNVQNNLNAQLAPLYQQSFESAQGRQLQAAGQLSQNALGLGGLQGSIYGTNLSGLQNFGQLGLAGAQLGQQAQQLNAQNQLAASQANASNMLQAGLATQGANVNIGLANQGAALQAATTTAQQQLAAQQANQQAGLNVGSLNLGALMQAGLAGQNTQQALALANQSMLGQYGMANANIMNQAGQYNTSNLNSMAQYNGQQGNLYNQFMTSIMGQASGMQNTQNQYNAGLVSLLAGLPIPQQQVSPYPAAIGNLGSTLMMAPFLNQALQQPQSYGGQPFSLPQTQVPNFTMPQWRL